MAICYTDGMEAVPDMSLYKVALIVLGAAGVVIPLFHRLRISPVLGFILVGVAVGPFGFGALTSHYAWLTVVTIGAPRAIQPVADLGVTLLLFMIGLELSFERLWLMRRLVFGLGSLQVAVSASVLTGAAALSGLSATSAIVVGIALTMSSTAVVLQVLSEERRLHTPAGRGSFSILLFQDLAVVPALFAVSALAPNALAFSATGFGIAIAQALLAVAGIVALGRLILRPLFRSVAHTRSTELFVAACLFVVIASALATAAAGLSMAVGALIGGLLLAGHRIPPPSRDHDRTVQRSSGRCVPDLDWHGPRHPYAPSSSRRRSRCSQRTDTGEAVGYCAPGASVWTALGTQCAEWTAAGAGAVNSVSLS